VALERSHDWSWDRVVSRRLHESHLIDRTRDAVAVARAVGGLQAQVPAAAELGLGVRTEGHTRGHLRRLIDETGLLTRTYAMRRTAHLLATEDLPLYSSAMRQLAGGDEVWFRGFGLDSRQAEALFSAVKEALDGRRLNRRQLGAVLRERLGQWVFDVFDPTLGSLSVAAAYAGVLAYGPNQGSESTFVRPDQRGDANWREVDGESALRELTRRYFAAYGPATQNDLARWLGIKVAQARDMVVAAGDALRQVTVEGRAAWLPADAAESESGAKCIRLLPQYDAYVLGSGPIGRVAPTQLEELIRRHKRGRYEGAAGVPVLLVDGVVAGVWERKAGAHRLRITVEPLHRLSAGQKAELEAEAVRVAEFDDLRLGQMLLLGQ